MPANDIPALLIDLQVLADDPQMAAPMLRALQARLRARDSRDAALDQGLAQLWQAARPVARALGLQPLLDGISVGPALRAALLDSVEADAASANAALDLLAATAAEDWQPVEWQRVARVARMERDKTVPDKEAALLLARCGPRQALPTVALTAFRPGPEDAEDRLTAIANIGRFADARAAAWNRALLQTGVATLECLQAVTLAQQTAPDLQPWLANLELACRLAATDAVARWTALDGLSHLDPARSLPWLHAAVAAAGADLPPWFVPYCRQRAAAVAALLPNCKPPPATLTPLPDLPAQVLARCPRIARRAAVLWQEQQGEPELLHQRAGIERALVERRQLLASFLATHATVPAQLGPQWAPNWLVLSDGERACLVAEESAWLGA